MLLGALGFPLPLLRFRLSSGRLSPCPGLFFNIGREHEHISQDRILFELSLVSTYHYKCFQIIKLNEELVQMFLSRSFPAILVGVMNQRHTSKGSVHHTVSNNVLARFVEFIACLHEQAQ